jgi:hypothetical protein
MLKSIPRINKQYIIFYENTTVKKEYARYKRLNVINMKKMYKQYEIKALYFIYASASFFKDGIKYPT